ncbi:mitochondrial import inner membrane translocase subunit Tim21 [Eleutherodactylus coqui]|uniref:Mitochondrial import inner membrane translocase subunit Tim21 n=1 Tax=Eleutherodactylus coqui TaxID=57060 RepID=A0A8J6K4P7_ELECQ|nr:hypothetical protein GDO78_012667 [Eleutherodactylus coqui]
MSLCRYVWRAAGSRQPLVYLSPSLLLQPRGGRAPSVCRCWVQPLFTGRWLSQKLKPRSSLQTKSEQKPPLTAAQKVQQAGADAAYFVVSLIGIGITGGLIYMLYTELVSSSSPYKIYGKAFEKCQSHPEVIAAFGEPISAFGEATRRGRRQHVASTKYFKNGSEYIRLKFYISGSEPRLQGTVYVELREDSKGEAFAFQYIIIEMDTVPRRTIVVEDNRHMA